MHIIIHVETGSAIRDIQLHVYTYPNTYTHEPGFAMDMLRIKTVPDSTQLCLIKGQKSKFPPDPLSLPGALHADMYSPPTPPNNPYHLIFPPLGKNLKESLWPNTRKHIHIHRQTHTHNDTLMHAHVLTHIPVC